MTQNSITRSWVASANGHADFPLQNLPLGVFSLNGSAPRAGVAIGEHIFDLQVALEAGLFDGVARSAVEAMHGGLLNAFFELGREARVALRERLLELFSEGSTHRGNIEAQGAKLLPLAADCQLHLPARISDYTDFYVGIEHAQNVGKLFRPDNPLLPNYKHVPIGYHGRASTVRASGTDVRRPKGQTLPAGPDRADLWPVRASGLRAGTGHLDRPGQRDGRVDRHRRRGRAHRRFLPAQRLVGPRHPGLGIPAAGSVPVEEFHHQRLAVGRHRRSAGAVPHARNRRVRKVIRNRCRTCSTSAIRTAVPSTSNWKCCCSPKPCASRTCRPIA